jgi:DNA polymerase-3 subunit gamma/tau
MAFAGQKITVEEVSTVLGLVGRDLLFELIEAVVSEDGPRAFAAADRAVQSGHDLKLVCRELSRVVRDMMVLSVDPARAGAELADEERTQLADLSTRFSREDLMRAFDLLAKAELDIRNASQPRYHFEMVLLRWMHLRKLVPLTDLMERMGAGGGVKLQAPTTGTPAPTPRAVTPRPAAPRTASRAVAPGPAAAPPSHTGAPVAPEASASARPPAAPVAAGLLKDAFLGEVRAGKSFFYNTVVAQAQLIEVAADAIKFAFLPTHRALREQFEGTRAWLETAAERVAGRRNSVTAVQAAASAGTAPAQPSPSATPAAPKVPAGTRDLRAEALDSSAVQAMLEVFPAEISDVEEM